MRFYCKSEVEVLKALNASENGLSQTEAETRLQTIGKNRLEAAKGKSLVRRLVEQLSDPMILILLAAAAISGGLAVVENESFADVIIILAVVIVNAVLGVYQESKAEKAIEALQEMSAATSKVLRAGSVQSIPSEDLVVGDIILVEAGDAVPADARILESASLQIEEAALTGESVPVTKFIDSINLREGEKDVPLGDRKNMMYMGSTVAYGRGKGVVTAIGMDTEMGKIAHALTQAGEGQTPLQRKLGQLLWINLVTDSFPALALGMEEAEPNIMRRKPRNAKSSIFADGMGFDIGYQGALVTFFVLLSYFIGKNMGGAQHGMTMAFLTMSLAEIFHSFNMRSQRQSIFTLGTQNKYLLLAGVGSFVATVLVCEVDFLANAFGFVPVGIEEFVIAMVLGACVIPVVELVKFIQRKQSRRM